MSEESKAEAIRSIPIGYVPAPKADRLETIEAVLSVQLDEIGRTIGYGRAQQILGDLWDESLALEFGAGPGRGRMGVTANEREAHRQGWEEALAAWAKHMQGMARAVKAAQKRGPK